MGRIEEGLLKLWEGKTILLGSFVLGLCGVGPLLLYMALGPADGNPIGLGLLAMLAVPVAAAGMLAGFVKMLVEFFIR